MKFLSAFAIAFLVEVAFSATWDYDSHGPSTWGNDYATCNGDKQSPIDVVTSSAEYNSGLSLKLSGYDTSVAWDIKNNGHTVGCNVPSSVTSFSLTAKDLYNWETNTWSLLGFHFHWGTSDSSGSENKLDGVQYPMEVHFVHGNTKYSSGYTDHDDGILVVGFFFEVGSADNSAFEKVASKMSDVPYKDNTATSSSFSVTDLLGTEWNEGQFFSWQGSLTTPECNQAVSWYLFTDTIVISSAQMTAMRTQLYEDDAGATQMDSNWRPVQPLNSRTIYTSDSNIVTANVYLALLLAGVVGKLFS